jgi:glycosyltransferase involved in cell wall biosynthesis
MGRGRYLGFIDADGDIDPELLKSFLEIMQADEPDIVLGSKLHPQSIVVYPPLRRIYSWMYQRLIHLMFRLSVSDTQTGLKFIRREVLANALPRMLEKRFAFDLELLVVARRIGYTDFREAPVRINERFTSTVSPRAVFRMMIDTMAIFYRLRILQYYEQIGGVPQVPAKEDPEIEAAGLAAVLTPEGQ